MTSAAPNEASHAKLDAWLVTDVGVVRDHNEDSAFMEPGTKFFIVADGMGGHAAGEVASAMAVETVKKTLEASHTEVDEFQKAPSDTGRRALVQLLQTAVLQAHQAVFQRGQTEADKAGMGTTLDVVLIAGCEAFVAHVGDSRTYLIRDGRSSQITTDHTVAEVLVIEGKLTIEEAQVSPLRTILVNAIGVSADVGVEMAHVQLRRGDRLLLCSDGLHDYFPVDEEIAQRLSAEKPGDALKEMVELAKTRGGHDNITGVAVHVTEIVDAAVEGTNEDSTHVDITTAPFMTEEVTQTAFVTDHGMQLPNTVNPAALRETQPMRAVEVEAKGDAKADPKPDAKPEKPAEPRADAPAKDGEPAKDGDAKAEKPEAKADGAPASELATADTGRAKAE